MEDKDEFDVLIEANAKSLDDRLGNSPEKIEKKAAGRKSMYIHSLNMIKKISTVIYYFIILIRTKTDNITI